MAAPLLLLLILQIYDKDVCVDVKMEFYIKKTSAFRAEGM